MSGYTLEGSPCIAEQQVRVSLQRTALTYLAGAYPPHVSPGKGSAKGTTLDRLHYGHVCTQQRRAITRTVCSVCSVEPGICVHSSAIGTWRDRDGAVPLALGDTGAVPVALGDTGAVQRAEPRLGPVPVALGDTGAVQRAEPTLGPVPGVVSGHPHKDPPHL
jgi:hypothetical protein